MTALRIILLLFLIVCALGASFSKQLLVSVSIYMAFSSIMAIIWLLLKSPDLAITEAAVGAGITSLLFFLLLKKTRSIHAGSDSADPEKRAPLYPDEDSDD